MNAYAKTEVADSVYAAEQSTPFSRFAETKSAASEATTVSFRCLKSCASNPKKRLGTKSFLIVEEEEFP